ncbi:hypothetical protein WJX84_011186 [Apatococcus fuscideae]|uniref:Uncharacterized protein n=1 Tax=Apatococcus fuscideae TaxID=2026836 RepID=A0AAW1T9C4_9CHLO
MQHRDDVPDVALHKGRVLDCHCGVVVLRKATAPLDLNAHQLEGTSEEEACNDQCHYQRSRGEDIKQQSFAEHCGTLEERAYALLMSVTLIKRLRAKRRSGRQVLTGRPCHLPQGRAGHPWSLLTEWWPNRKGSPDSLPVPLQTATAQMFV